jgi:hypothetical protein
MSLSERFIAGFALAATIARDPGASAARAGLAGPIVDAWTYTARELLALGKAERRARIRSLTEPAPLQFPDRATVPVRAFALLARQANHSQAALHWLAATPLPRAGYAPDAALTALLARIAARTPRVGA